MIYARGIVIFIANPWAGNRIALKKKKGGGRKGKRREARERAGNHRKQKQNLHI